ncbi:NAD(P)H-binding protein [Ideonella sp.]|uniref:NAD(P)H-binding protein n=1 Tax=Ideonella sp. TaxID=1929293 RepID=UPI003BB5AE74
MAAELAIILGASGSVGQALVAEALRCGRFSKVVVLVRRPLDLSGLTGGDLVQRQVLPMAPDTLRQAVVDTLQDFGGEAVGFSVMGVGANTAKMSLAAHRAVDVDLNAAFACGLKASGKVRHLAFMSAVGADIHASTSGSGAAGMPRYARVKGEAEAAVMSPGLAVVSIFRPSVIIGSQHTPALLAAAMGLLSPLIPRKFRPIRTTEIAQAMVAVALESPEVSAIYSYAEMKSLTTPSHRQDGPSR